MKCRVQYGLRVTSTVPFQYLAHLLTVPVLAGDVQMRFILDTGIGVNLLSESAAARAGWSATGTTYTGRRMSGQEVRLPIGSVASVRLGDASGDEVPFGVLDIGAAAGLDGIDGFLSLNFFWSAPVTVDCPASVVVVEDECSLALRAESGFPADVLVEHDGPATQVRLPLRLPTQPRKPPRTLSRPRPKTLRSRSTISSFCWRR